MSNYIISKIYKSDIKTFIKIDTLLASENIRKDKNLDYTCAIFDDDMNVIATGSCFKNTLRCLAVSKKYQGEGLMNEIISHLIDFQFSNGVTHLFLYTKNSSAKFFKDLGFFEIINIENQLVFLENKKNGFKNYLSKLSEETNINGNSIAAIVMNANPFTLGHQFLIEKAASENDILHLFIVSEDSSLVPFKIREKLIKLGTSHLKNICYHTTDSYLISSATFPSYFQKDETAVIESQANLDIMIFKEISKKLGINRRYVGEEPNSLVTNIYNEIMIRELPKNNIECIVIDRKKDINNEIISASTVRQAIKDNNIEYIKNLVPQTTYNFFTSDEAKEIIKNIQKENNVIHY